MSFASNIFTKLGLGEDGEITRSMASFIPQYATPPRQPVDEHDLAELSPRPQDTLLPHDPPAWKELPSKTRSSMSASRSSRKGKAKATVTIQEPAWSPTRTDDTLHDYRTGRAAYQQREQKLPTPETSSPSFPSFSPEPLQPSSASPGPQMSFFESMFISRPTRPTYADRAPPSKIDQTFRALERRERSMQKEIQDFLDAQDHALERHLADEGAYDSISQPSSTPEVATGSKGHVVPVRQPKKRHLSKREARSGILRCLSQLSNLKNEEEAYIATALAERKSALSRLRNLSSKRSNLVTEMKAVESDRDRSRKGEIETLEQQHRGICEDIETLGIKLRGLKHKRSRLESKIAEAKSTRDSELSGYAGALKECDKRIADVMNFPGIAVLEVESLMAQDADMKALVGDHLSGFEFLSLRPERRTSPMAKDWWEGELQILELRKIAVERDRDALDEGAQLWQDIVGRLEAQDQHLNLAMEAMGSYLKHAKKASEDERKATEGILKKQYEMSKTIITDLEDLQKYAEARGWNPLVLSLTAELNYAMRLKVSLGETLSYIGWAEGIVTPQSSSPRPPSDTQSKETGELLGSHHSDAKSGAVVDDLTGSVIRRWDDTADDNDKPATPPIHDNSLHDTTNANEESDNEVPPGLFSETIHDSDDEHNQIPPEFLSMHSPRGKVVMSGSGNEKETSVPAVAGPDPDQLQAGGRGGGEEQLPALSRQSSTNDVPHDLLAEGPHDD